MQVCSCHWAWCCSPGWALLQWPPPRCPCCCPPCYSGRESQPPLIPLSPYLPFPHLLPSSFLLPAPPQHQLCDVSTSCSFRKTSLENYQAQVRGYMNSLSSSQISTHLGAEWGQGWGRGREQDLADLAPVQGTGAAPSNQQGAADRRSLLELQPEDHMHTL